MFESSLFFGINSNLLAILVTIIIVFHIAHVAYSKRCASDVAIAIEQHASEHLQNQTMLQIAMSVNGRQ